MLRRSRYWGTKEQLFEANVINTLMYKFVPLQTEATSTNWDGDSFSTTSATKIDLSSEFGIPDNVKAVLVRVSARDSGSQAGGRQYIILGPSSTSGGALVLELSGVDNDAWRHETGIIPCDDNGDIYYTISASGTDTMEIHLLIFGYWI